MSTEAHRNPASIAELHRVDRSPQLAPIFTECGHVRVSGGALGKNVWRAHEVRCHSERIDVTTREVRWLGDD